MDAGAARLDELGCDTRCRVILAKKKHDNAPNSELAYCNTAGESQPVLRCATYTNTQSTVTEHRGSFV